MISNNHKKDHTFVLVKRANEIIFALPNGEEIARVYVDTMEDENKKPTDNFFLVFETVERCPLEKNIATVNVPKGV